VRYLRVSARHQVPRDFRTRFWIALTGRERIEPITGRAPDGGSGSLEWRRVISLLISSLALNGLARTEWKHRLGASSAGWSWRG
jgi:hypothetical protein